MTPTNGTPEESPILSLDQARRKPGKSGDWLTRADAEKMVAQAIAQNVPQIHEFYLNQLPNFTARMIQDALLSYGLIALPPSDIASVPSELPVETESVVQGENGGLMVTEP